VTGILNIVQYGLDPLGCEVLRNLDGHPGLKVVAAIDPGLAGSDRSISEATQISGYEDAPIFASFGEVPPTSRPDAVFHTAGTGIRETLEQLRPLCENGLTVVTSCGEMLYPWLRAPELASEIDRVCRRNNARVVGSGTNPGSGLNLLPISMAGLTGKIRGVFAESVSDAVGWHRPLQDRLGLGSGPEDFREGWANGRLGQAGLHESLLVIAHSLGWNIPAMDQWCEPIIADREFRLSRGIVARGQVRGLHQIIRAFTPARESIQLELKVVLEAEDPHDLVRIQGDNPIEARIPGGLQGGRSKAWALIKTLPRLRPLAPGLKLITDLPAAAGFAL